MDMQVPASTSQYPSLDCLRTVEFRQTLRGYHVEDVDDYLEKVAVEAESLQEQLRLATERLRQAAERVQALESERREAPMAAATTAVEPVAEEAPLPVAAASSAVAGTESAEALSRTLLLAQKFVEQTHAEAKAEAESLVTDAEASARSILSDAKERAQALVDDAQRALRDEVARLEGSRDTLQGQVEALSRHLEGERARLRGIVADLSAWVDERLLPSGDNRPTLTALAGSDETPVLGPPATNNGFGH